MRNCMPVVSPRRRSSVGAGALGVSWFTGPFVEASPAARRRAAGAFDGTKPSVIEFSGDDGDVVTGIHWSKPGHQSARGAAPWG